MKKILAIFLFTALALSSCKKWLDQPPTGALREELFTNAQDAQETLLSCYDALANLYDGDIQALSELLTDNLNAPNSNNNLQSVYNRQTNFFNETTKRAYQDLYIIIWRCNTLLDNIDLITDFGAGEKERLIAEARFLRGYCHWAAVKLWAQPYGYSSDNSHPGVPIRKNANAEALQRSSVKEVYDYVIGELKFAYENLPESNGIYAGKYSAAGALASVYFLMNDFENTVTYSNEVINSGQFALLSGMDRYPAVVLDTNTTSEFVFGTVSTIYTVASGSNVQDSRCGAFLSNYRVNNGIAELMLSQNFQDYINLNPVDKRIDEWMEFANNRAFLYKMYRNLLYSVPIIHLTELKLMRAEALAEMGSDLGTAISDVNDIRNRAFDVNTNILPANATAEEIIAAARREYRIETIGEGKYVEQLRRYGVMGENTIIRDAPWDCPGMVLQFPNAESTVIGFQLNPEGGCN